MPSVIFVRATPDHGGNFAVCSYYSDQEGQHQIPGSSFSVPKDTGECAFSEADGSELKLIGATFSNLGGTPVMSTGNFCPADTTKSIRFNMPGSFVSTMGVVLLFSNPSIVDNIYPSSDPQVTNDGITPPSTPNS